MTISVRKSRTEDHHASKPNRYVPEIMPERHIPQLLGGRGHITLPATKVRPHEDGRAGHGRTRRDRLESAVPGFARYWGFKPRLCRPYRAQTKGKVESGVKYVRRNFLCGLQGREPTGLIDLNGQLRWWVAEVANQRVHGTTHEQVMIRWEADRADMSPVTGRLPYPYMDDEQRKVARDAYVSWKGSRYSVPWSYAGKEVWVRDHGPSVEIRYSAERIAVHAPASRRHQVVTLNHHHIGIPPQSRQNVKTLIHIAQTAPVVEHRPLAAYESLACGGAL